MSEVKAKRGKGQRECGFCHEKGHNTRTCPQKKLADGANGGGTSAEMSAPTPTRTSAPPIEMVAGPMMMSPAAVTEFEESTKQISTRNAHLRVSIRENAQGLLCFIVSHASNGITNDLRLNDVEEAGKLYELLGWVLQRQEARKQRARMIQKNGAGRHTTAAAQ